MRLDVADVHVVAGTVCAALLGTTLACMLHRLFLPLECQVCLALHSRPDLLHALTFVPLDAHVRLPRVVRRAYVLCARCEHVLLWSAEADADES